MRRVSKAQQSRAASPCDLHHADKFAWTAFATKSADGQHSCRAAAIRSKSSARRLPRRSSNARTSRQTLPSEPQCKGAPASFQDSECMPPTQWRKQCLFRLSSQPNMLTDLREHRRWENPLVKAAGGHWVRAWRATRPAHRRPAPVGRCPCLAHWGDGRRVKGRRRRTFHFSAFSGNSVGFEALLVTPLGKKRIGQRWRSIRL